VNFPAAEYYLAQIDTLIGKSAGRYGDRWGWHDDHREADGGLGYKPAMMQVRAEYGQLIDLIVNCKGILGGRALQLGIGPCQASHDALRLIFAHVTSIDWNGILQDTEHRSGGDTHSLGTAAFARAEAPYDFLLIDAGHRYYDVQIDHQTFGPMVRPGGIIAFHDAIRRPQYPLCEVWRYLDEMTPRPPVLGTEVGFAWIAK
jgi:hypothetical protein